MRFLYALAGFVQPVVRHPNGIMAILRHMGGLGLFLLAILDGSPIPAFGGPDILTAILSARQREPWYYYALIATVGGLIGSCLTFRMAHKAGLDYLSRKFGQRKVARLMEFSKRWGTGTLVVTAVLPVPSPTTAFVAIAGVLDYPLRTFIIVMALGRAVRYGAIALVASHYGRRFVTALRHPGRYAGWILAITAAVVIATAAVVWLTKLIQSDRDEVKTRAI
jgi:membrane protein YqaA with SNARE-associated domain